MKYLFSLIIILFSFADDLQAQIIYSIDPIEKCHTAANGTQTSFIEWRTAYNSNAASTFLIRRELPDGSTYTLPSGGTVTLGFCTTEQTISSTGIDTVHIQNNQFDSLYVELDSINLLLAQGDTNLVNFLDTATIFVTDTTNIDYEYNEQLICYDINGTGIGNTTLKMRTYHVDDEEVLIRYYLPNNNLFFNHPLPQNFTYGQCMEAMTVSPFTASNQATTMLDDNANFSIPAGKIKVYVKNLGAHQTGDSNSHITVNGIRLDIGQEEIFEVFNDEVLRQTKYTPLLTIVTNGARVQGYFTE